MFYVKITVKCGVLCKTKCNLWFSVKKSRRYGVIRYLLDLNHYFQCCSIIKLNVANRTSSFSDMSADMKT
jgi:hypothetical protein